MEIKQINQLMQSMIRHGMKKLSIKKEGIELHLEREEKAPSGHIEEENPLHDDFQKRHSPIAQAHPKEEHEEMHFIASPMVGTVYLSPSPHEPVFVKVGDHVEKNSVVCLVEAMKVMNEVKAGMSGTVHEVMTENAHPVEFGTKLFRIRAHA